jgi:hypothetical protein
MGGSDALKTSDEGALTPVKLALMTEPVTGNSGEMKSRSRLLVIVME